MGFEIQAEAAQITISLKCKRLAKITQDGIPIRIGAKNAADLAPYVCLNRTEIYGSVATDTGAKATRYFKMRRKKCYGRLVFRRLFWRQIQGSRFIGAYVYRNHRRNRDCGVF